jgi:hypothetical protein
MPPTTLTVQQVADHYGTTPHTVGTWIRSGELKAVNVARDRHARRPTYRITAESLAAFEAARSPPLQPAVKARRRKPAGEVIAFY